MSQVQISKKERKRRILETIKELVRKYPTVMLADFYRIPGDAFQKIRADLRPHTRIYVAKRRLIAKAFKEVNSERKNIERLVDYIPQNAALICSSKSPLEVARLLREKEARVFARPGEIAEEDIEIPEGPTDLTPGPVLNDLRALGVQTKIKGGKISIEKSQIVLRRGEKIPRHIADILRMLDVRPMKVGLRTSAAVDQEGILYSSDILGITDEEIFEQISEAAAKAITLACEVGEVTSQTVPILVARAVKNANCLAVEVGWITEKTLPQIIRRVVKIAEIVSSKIGE